MELFSYAVIGGLGAVAGAVSGVGLFRLLDFVLAKQFSGEIVAILRYTLSGAGLLWILYFLPGGLWQFVQRGRDVLLRRVAAKHDLVVPSLVADKPTDDDGHAAHRPPAQPRGHDGPPDPTPLNAGAMSCPTPPA